MIIAGVVVTKWIGVMTMNKYQESINGLIAVDELSASQKLATELGWID